MRGQTVHLGQRSLGQRQDFFFGFQMFALRCAARYLLEIVVFHLQRERLSFKIVFGDTLHEFEHGVIEFDDNGRLLTDILRKRMLAAH